MDCSLFSQSVGYIGSTVYSLKSLKTAENLDCKWPRFHVLHLCSSEKLFDSILKQNVGIDRSFAYRDACNPLKVILGKFLKCHCQTNYKNLFRKCKTKGRNNQLQSTSRRVIKEYIHRIVFKVIPLHLFGTKLNAIQFERNVRKIIFFGKYQVFSLSMVLHSIRVKSIAFLRSIEDHDNKTNLIAKLFVWLVRAYILTALKCVLHVTESAHSNKYVFYEKTAWKKIQRHHIRKIEKQILGIHKNCIISGIVRSEHLYTVKLLPKRCGCRPIFLKLHNNQDWRMKCHLNRKIAKILLSRVAGDYFRNAHLTWRVFHGKWLSLHEKWKSDLQPVLYFVRTDFIDAFASVDLTKMTDIISKIRKKNYDAPDICFRSQGWLRNIPLNSAFKILENYTNKIFFKHNGRVYRLIKGLCQGGQLSSQLFNLYLGEWEKSYLTEYVDDRNGFFIRNCDDCLYVTMDHAKASSYLRLVEEGFPDFNLFVNLLKTETNIRNESQVTVRFCNYTLDMHCFQVLKQYRNCSVFHSSRFPSLKSPGKIILERFGRPCIRELKKVFLDPAYNTNHTILYNVFMVARFTGANCLAHMERLFLHFNEKFIMTCLSICSRQIARIASASLQSDVEMNQNMFQWIVVKAFLTQMKELKSKNFVSVMLQVDGFLKNLFLQLDIRQQEIIWRFFRIHCPQSLKPLS